MKKLLALLLMFPLVANAATFWSFDWETLPTANTNNAEGIFYQGNCFEKALGDPFSSIELSTKYVRTGSTSARLYTDSKYANAQGHRNCASMYKTETITVNGVTYLKHRNEPKYAYSGTNSLPDFQTYQVGEERWFRYSFYFPSDEGTFAHWNTGPYASKGIMIMQIFAQGGASGGTHEVAFTLSGGPKMKVEQVYGTKAGEEIFVNLGTFNLKKDAWNDVVFMHLPDYDADGRLKVWLNCSDWANCTPIVDRSGPTAIYDFTDRYWKGGLYEMNMAQYDRAIAQYVDSHKMGKKDGETEAEMLALMSDVFTSDSGGVGGNNFIYTDDFQADLPIEHERNFLNKKCREDQYTRVADPANVNSGNYVFKAFLDGDNGCDESGVEKYRTQLTFGINGDNGNPLYVNQDESTWLSFKLYVDPSTPDGSSQTFVQAQEVGESAMMIVGNDILRVIPERYRAWDGSDFGNLIEKRITDIPIIPGQWYTITSRIYKRTSTQNDGEYELWVNGVKKIDLTGIITGSDLRAAGDAQATYDLGPYHGSGARSGNTTYYIDDIKFARGKNNYTLFGVNKNNGGGTPVVSNLVINGGAVVNSSQNPINFTVSDVYDITNCVIGNTPYGVKFDYVNGNAGKFAGPDTTGFSSTGEVKCYNEDFINNPTMSGVNMTEVNVVDSSQTSLDHWGYTSGRRIYKSASGVGEAYWVYGSAYNTVVGDRARFDITYSCTGSSCENMYFDIMHNVTTTGDKRIRLSGTAGALVAGQANSVTLHGSNYFVRNYTLPDNTYRVVFWFTVTESNNYRIRAGWSSASAADLTMDILESVMRKNWTTTELTAPILYSVDDTTAPILSGCGLGNNPSVDNTYKAYINCTADEIGGTDYAIITTSNTAPDEAAMKAGTSTDSIWSSQKAADTTEIAFEASGMSYQDLWGWIMRCDAADNCSTVQGVTFDDGRAPGEVKKIKFANNYDGMGGNRLIYTRDVNGNPVLYPEEETIDRLVILDGDPRYESPVAAPPVIATFRDLELDADGVLEVEETDVYSGSVNELKVGTPKWFMLWNLDGSFNALGTIKPIAE